MCGITGLVAKYQNGFWRSHAELFSHMVRMNSIRGWDSTGVFGVTLANNVDICKGDADGYVFTRSKPYSKFETKINRSYRIVVGHNRSATKGSITPHNAHPFQEGNIVMVHNGTIWNSDDLNKEVEVDSHAICHALNDHNAVEALGKINGAFALAWYNKQDKTLNLARNTQRPLWLFETDDFWLFSSEPGLPAWLLGRATPAIKVKEATPIDPDKIISFNLSSLAKGPTEVKYEEYKAPVSEYNFPTHWGPHWKNQTYQALPPPPKDPITPIFQNKPRIPLGKSKNEGILKIGERVLMSFKDYKDIDVPANGMLFIGHPIFDGEMDENIICRYTATEFNKDNISTLILSHDFFYASITGMTNYCGVPCMFVNDLTPVTGTTTFNGETFSKADLVQILGDGCPRCKKPISLEDAGKTFIRQRKDGTYRVVCGDCIGSVVNPRPITEVQASVH